MTPQQRELHKAAVALYSVIEGVVPPSTAHYAVESARKAALVLARVADTVHTIDAKDNA